MLSFNDPDTLSVYPLSLHDALPICAEGDAVCTWERALGSKRRECFLTRRLPKDRSACRVGGVNCAVGRDGEIVELVSEIGEHTSELQSHHDLVCRLLLEKKKTHPSH